MSASIENERLPSVDHDYERSFAELDASERLRRIRHSLAHVLGQAVRELRPGAKLGFGPAIEDGFYYDFLLPDPISEKDFPSIEARMREILASGHRFVFEPLPSEAALAKIEAMGEPYKRAYADELFEVKRLSSLGFYRSGSFEDMCDGPHVPSMNDIPPDCFKLASVAGAHWRGRSDMPRMSRIRAWAWGSAAELREKLEERERALLRDHKKLGKELDIFAFDDDIGKGLPLWLPNGTVLRDELESLMKDLEFEDGYQRVVTPHLARRELYLRTGHLPYYAEHMFPPMVVSEAGDDRGSGPDSDSDADSWSDGRGDGESARAHGRNEEEVYYLRPMNCPHHHKIFDARKRSYRELPLRLAEYGQTYRFEDSGAVSGLLRVRGMCMNDAHVYCARDQIVVECRRVLDMHRRVYGILGLEDWRVRLSLHRPGEGGRGKFVDDPDGWAEAEGLLRQVLVESGLPFVEGPGEAAFYGPKIDFQFRSVTGREETASTLQLDFGSATRLDLRYVGPDGVEHHPYILHRAPLGTHERFVALLLEHYAGAFPTWLAPVQVRVVPVAARFAEYGRAIVARLRAARIRAELDDGSEGLAKKIRSASNRKIPHVVVVGEREAASGTVSVRRFGASGGEAPAEMPLEAFVDELRRSIDRRSDDRVRSPERPAQAARVASDPRADSSGLDLPAGR